MSESSQYIMLYTHIIPVRGYSRSILMDLYKGKYLFIPNYFCDFLIENKSRLVQRNDFLNLGTTKDDREEISELLNELLIQDYFIESDRDLVESLHVEIKDKTEDSVINDCIIELSQHSKWDVNFFLHEINKLGVKFLEVRFLDFSSFSNLFSLIQDALKSHSIEYLHFLVPSNIDLESTIRTELINFNRLNQLTVYNSKSTVEIADTPFDLVFSNQESICSSQCGCVNPGYFTYNLTNYTSHLKNNSCLSLKLSIDQYGDIKNCPSKKVSFGQLENGNIEQIIQSEEFQRDWHITKNEILICSDCEFRWMCSDCRVFTQDESNRFSKPSKCGYNPYINKWNTEEGYLTESECGISIVDNRLNIEKAKLNQINSALWD